MGTGASTDRLKREGQKPADASDISGIEDAKKEIIRLRSLIKEESDKIGSRNDKKEEKTGNVVSKVTLRTLEVGDSTAEQKVTEVSADDKADNSTVKTGGDSDEAKSVVVVEEKKAVQKTGSEALIAPDEASNSTTETNGDSDGAKSTVVVEEEKTMQRTATGEALIETDEAANATVRVTGGESDEVKSTAVVEEEKAVQVSANEASSDTASDSNEPVSNDSTVKEGTSIDKPIAEVVEAAGPLPSEIGETTAA